MLSLSAAETAAEPDAGVHTLAVCFSLPPYSLHQAQATPHPQSDTTAHTNAFFKTFIYENLSPFREDFYPRRWSTTQTFHFCSLGTETT